MPAYLATLLIAVSLYEVFLLIVYTAECPLP